MTTRTRALPLLLAWASALHSVTAATLYVWPGSPNPTAPYADWATAAQVIQEAVDAAHPGDTVWVTNGVYASGGRAVHGTMTNRVTIDRAILVRSVNGPQWTVVEGAAAPGGGNGDGAISCVYLDPGAVLDGFTLRNGHTRTSGHSTYERSGGGVRSLSGGMVTNCVLTGNAAALGGGAYQARLYHCTLSNNTDSAAWQCTLHNCLLAGNTTQTYGGGARRGTLFNCVLTGNTALHGGATYYSTLYNCTVTGNAASVGGGVYRGQLYNSLVYYNTAGLGSNYYQGTFDHCATIPRPAEGPGNISGDPQLASASHLSAGSPCIGAGSADYSSGVDIDGEPWATPPCIGADQYLPGGATGALTVAIGAPQTNLAAGFPALFTARLQGYPSASRWEFGDGTVVSNQLHLAHGWTVPGDYDVTLTVWNTSFPDGIVATCSVRVVDRPVYYVDAANPHPSAPYTNWPTAAATIQEAIDAGEVAGRLVWVTNGVYDRGEGTWAAGLLNRVALSNPVTVQSVNGPDTTFIQGDDLEDAQQRCAYVGAQAVLSGFTLTNGHTAEEGWGLEYAEPGFCGGGAFAEITGLLSNCVLAGNVSGWSGGGVHGGTLYDCLLTGNSAKTDLYARGGGASYATLHNCILSSNAVEGCCELFGAGAHYCLLTHCLLTGNVGPQTQEVYGGGADKSVLYHCTLTGNTVSDGGGAAGSTLYACTLAGNAASVGGAVSSSTLYNCLITDNSASAYGCVYDSSLYQCTVTSNRLAWEDAVVISSTLVNCILYDNAPYNFDYYTILYHSCTTPLPRRGFGNITNRPVYLDPTAGDFRLAYGSPGIDAGTNLSALLSTDINGLPRPLDGDGDGTAAFDMGAYELDLRTVVPTNWLLRYGLNPSDPHVVSANPDLDALTTFQEWVADTDPIDPYSCFAIHHLEATSDSQSVIVFFLSSSNRLYTLFSASNLESGQESNAVWTTVLGQTDRPGRGGMDTLSDTRAAPHKFYRVAVQPPTSPIPARPQ